MDMRIANAYSTFSVYNVKNTPAPKKASQSEKVNQVKDTFTLSGEVADYQLAKKAVAAAPDIREDKVAALKQKIEAGTYKTGGREIAAKLFHGRDE